MFQNLYAHIYIHSLGECFFQTPTNVIFFNQISHRDHMYGINSPISSLLEISPPKPLEEKGTARGQVSEFRILASHFSALTTD